VITDDADDQQRGLPETWDDGDPFVTAPENHGGDTAFIGSRVKLDQDTGEYLKYGMDLLEPEVLPKNTECEVNGSRFAYVHLEEGVQTEFIPYGNGVPKPQREDLLPSKPVKTLDPWVDTGYLYLTVLQTGEQITVYGGGETLRRAINRLAMQIKSRQQNHPGVRALIRLNSRPAFSRQYHKRYHAHIFTTFDWLLANGQRLTQITR
jgi:hypothetical protein